MSDVISEYQKWKQQGDDLRLKAKQAMETRFRELLTEAVQIAGEYRADFGSVLKPPTSVTSFRYKAAVKAKAKKSEKAKSAAKAAEPKAEVPPQKPSRKIAGMQTRLETAKLEIRRSRKPQGSRRVCSTIRSTNWKMNFAACAAVIVLRESPACRCASAFRPRGCWRFL